MRKFELEVTKAEAELVATNVKNVWKEELATVDLGDGTWRFVLKDQQTSESVTPILDWVTGYLFGIRFNPQGDRFH